MDAIPDLTQSRISLVFSTSSHINNVDASRSGNVLILLLGAEKDG